MIKQGMTDYFCPNDTSFRFVDLKLAVVNHDNLNCPLWNATNIHLGCPMQSFEDVKCLDNSSCFFTRQLEESLDIIYLNNTSEARSLAEAASVYGWIRIPSNFAQGLLSRLEMNENTSFPVINIKLDAANSIIFQDLQRKIFEAVHATLFEILDACQLSDEHASLGLSHHELWSAVGGEAAYDLNLAMLPGLVVVLHHLLAMALTADQLVSEFESGLIARQLASNVSVSLSILSQFTFHLCIVCPQV